MDVDVEIGCGEEVVADSSSYQCVVKSSSGSGQGCCVPLCQNNYRKTSADGRSVSYYRLPANQKRCSQWLRLIRLENLKPQPHHRVCSDHFVSGMCFCNFNNL